MATEGLRERKKQTTRDALTEAAVLLARERGLRNVRVEDIAAEAGVSPRTFNNYFGGKHEALAARQLDRTRESAEILRGRPADEPLWAAITHAVLAPVVGTATAEDLPDPAVLAGIRRLVEDSALLGEAMRAELAPGGEFVAAVAARTGTDPERDMYPRLVAAAVAGAAHIANDQWLRADPPAPLVDLLRDALRQVAAGLPDPSAARGAE